MTNPILNSTGKGGFYVMNVTNAAPANPKCCSGNVRCAACAAAALSMTLNTSHGDCDCKKNKPTWNAPQEKCEPLYTPPLFSGMAYNVAMAPDSIEALVTNRSAPLYTLPSFAHESEPVRNVRPTGKPTVDPMHDSSGPLYTAPMIF